MITFTLTHFASDPDEITKAADRGAVRLTDDGDGSYVLLRADEYERLQRRALDPRRAFLTAEMPDDLYDLLADDIAGLDPKAA